MFKFLKDVVVGSGGVLKDLPYNIGDPYSICWGSWKHYRGNSKENSSPVSIFVFQATNAQDGRLTAARNGVKRLRTVRHPNVLVYLHSTEVELTEGGQIKPTIYMVTEPVMPLEEKLKQLNLQGSQRDEYYAWGLHQISKAVSFLNNDCKLVHGNVCATSVVVTPTLDWKLYAFDVLSEFDGSNSDANGPMLPHEWLVGTQYKPLELVKSEWATIRKSPPWALDSWGLGCLIYELFAGTKLLKSEELQNTSSIPKSLLSDYQRLLSSTPSRRLNSSKLIENSGFFHNKLVETIQFMEVLNLKDSVEKDSFFRKLTNLSEQLPQEIVLKKLLPMLAAALEFGSASSAALGPLLKMGSWLSQEELISKVLPTAVKLFASSDRAIRVGLLQNIEQLGPALSNQVVDEQIFSHIATGFSDSSAFLRELTLKSMLILAPKLSQRTLTTSLLKYLNKLQVDEEPAIRTNTTILLGNIATHLNESTRKRVLINAFSRALRDGFSPAKSAGIMAFSATSEYYDVIEIATRILPSLVVLTIDADSDVRTKAFQATNAFLQLVQQYHSKLENGESISSATTATTSSGSLLGWAVSSITHKNKGMDIAATVPMSIHPAQAAVATISPSTPDQQAISASSSQLDIPPLETSSDGWGDAEDTSLPEEWDDVGVIEKAESIDPLSRLQAAQQRPIVSVKSVANGPKAFQTGAGNVETNKVEQSVENWGNDDDPWAEIAAPPPPTKAKPLSSATNKVGGAPKARQAQHISLGQHVSLESVLGSSGTGRGRGKAAPMKLGAQRVQRTSDF